VTDPISLQRKLAAELIGPHGGLESRLGFLPTWVILDGHVELVPSV
jgi:hypothetical protein